MTTPTLIFPQGIANTLHNNLLGGPPERLALAIARPVPLGPETFVVDGPLIHIPEEAYEVRHHGAVVLTDTASDRMNAVFARASLAGQVPVHIHSHPRGARFFSSVDTRHSADLATWLARQGARSFWAMVWPEDNDPLARLWTPNNPPMPGRIRLGLRPVDPTDIPILPALDRQKIFGPAFRAAAAELKVGIIGVGGLGMLIAEDLARAGFRRFAFIDPDVVEESNLHRLPGVGRHDIGRPKVDIARRTVEAACKAVGTIPEVRTLRQPVGTPRSRWRSTLLGCHIVLGLTDDALGRSEALDFALNTGSVYMQAGLGIDVDEKTGTVTRIQAEMCTAEPGHHCPVCADRLSLEDAAIETRLYAGDDIAEHARKAGYVRKVQAPAVLSLNRQAAAILCWEIQRRIAGFTPRDFVRVDLLSGGMEQHVQLGRLLGDEACSSCGRGELVVSL